MEFFQSDYEKCRAPTVAGIFYPEDRETAEEALLSFTAPHSASPYTSHNSAIAVIVPHAGWELSGKIAANTFQAAAGRSVSTVVVIGPMHRPRVDGLFLSESECFQTPIGNLPVDQTLCAELESCGTNFMVNDIPHLEEHSIEVVLPFIKHFFPAASIVPIITSGMKPSLVKALSNGLDFVFAPIIDSVLFVVSTNLCANLETNMARKHADEFMARIEKCDAPGLLQGTATGELSACGAAACAALLSTEIIRKRTPVVISRADSSEKPDHDPRKLVKYAGIAYF